MSQRVRITVKTELVSVLDAGDYSVDPADLAAADLTPDDLADALCRSIETRAVRARYEHKPRRETGEMGGNGRDYSTTDAPD